MPFQIRNTHTEDFDESDRCDVAYYEHLEKLDKKSNRAIWKYFYWDFFHDGRIDSIIFRSDLKTVTMALNCPNIVRIDSAGNTKYVNVAFICTFQNVASFTLTDMKPSEWFSEEGRPAVFLHSEINTSPLLKDLKFNGDFCSLMIEMLAGDATTWVEILFSQVDVKAVEPAAFSLMESNSSFKVPVYPGV